MDILAEILTYVYLVVMIVAVGFLQWLGKDGLTQLFTSSLKLEFDRKLAEVQSNFRQDELRLSSELQQKTKEINELKEGALSNSKLRKQAEYDRRINALDVVWRTVAKGRKLETVVGMMSLIDHEVMSATLNSGPTKMQPFSNLTKDLTVENLEFLNAAHEVRPYLPDAVWSLFSAYQTLLGTAVVACEFLRSGTPPPKEILDEKEFDRILKNAMPELARLNKTLDYTHTYLILTPLVERTLATIRKAMSGEDFTQAEIEEAKKIQDAAQTVRPA
ncbi:cell division protein FtsB [Rheinheimera pacifica]|uniref:hypothetical protein n=1 Tax=Rheinheimera pacifica TaxID=173990 RepID=UPI00286162A4|nr:hypothetical protein [Rheinheimera pacifica]MDR6983553.1 cell division protein FtsB [Rheinheimera pacifica]